MEVNSELPETAQNSDSTCNTEENDDLKIMNNICDTQTDTAITDASVISIDKDHTKTTTPEVSENKNTNNVSLETLSTLQENSDVQSNMASVNKPRRKQRSRLEIELGITEIESVLGDEQFDTFTDDISVYRKYKLRDKSQREQILSASSSSDDDENDFVQEQKRIKKYRKLDDCGEIQCEHCYKKFVNRKGYIFHIRTHVPAVYTCAICGDKFKCNRDMVLHKKVHGSENFACETCKVAFSNHCDYITHNIEHMKSPFKCAECSLVIDKVSTFKTHILTHYHGEMECEICNKMIKPWTYNRHLRNHARTIECVECGRISNSKASHNYHMVSHTQVKRYQCLYCGKAFSSDGQRNVHTRIHTDERPFECKVCQVRFKQSTDLKYHMVTHDSEKRFKCDLCPKKYYQKHSLDIHKRLHLNKNLVKCAECGQTFQNMTGLRAHTVYKHLDEQPYRCDACGVAFKHTSSYSRHCKSRMHRNNLFGFMNKTEKVEAP